MRNNDGRFRRITPAELVPLLLLVGLWLCGKPRLGRQLVCADGKPDIWIDHGDCRRSGFMSGRQLQARALRHCRADGFGDLGPDPDVGKKNQRHQQRTKAGSQTRPRTQDRGEAATRGRRGGVEFSPSRAAEGDSHLLSLLAREIAFAWIVAEAPVVSQDGIHVRVAREHPGIHQAAPVHRVPFA